MRRGLRTLTVCALGSVAWLLSAAPALGDTRYPAELSGAEVVPGPGDPDAAGFAVIVLEPEVGVTCLGLELTGATAVTAITIRVGGPGETGELKATLPIPPDLEGSTDCNSGNDQEALASIVADPEGHYVQVATEEFPDGAVRGQLGAPVFTTRASAQKVACPPEITGPEDIGDDGIGPCRIVVAGDEDVDPPDGYTWEVPPLSFPGMSITVTDGTRVLTLDEADRDGGGFCNPATFTCVFGRFYSWQEVVVGPTTIREVTNPDGYRLGWVRVSESSKGGTVVDYELDVATGSVTFDSSNHPNGVGVVFFDVVAQAATPTPEPTNGPGPTPRPTLPPTSTEAAGEPGSALALAVGWLASALVVLALTLRHRGRSI